MGIYNMNLLFRKKFYLTILYVLAILMAIPFIFLIKGINLVFWPLSYCIAQYIIKQDRKKMKREIAEWDKIMAESDKFLMQDLVEYKVQIGYDKSRAGTTQGYIG
jgi:hypothetical protein